MCFYYSFNSVPNYKNYALFRLRAFADEKLKVTQMKVFFSDSVENNEGKGENAGCQHFLLFPHCFQKASLPGLLKSGIVW